MKKQIIGNWNWAYKKGMCVDASESEGKDTRGPWKSASQQHWQQLLQQKLWLWSPHILKLMRMFQQTLRQNAPIMSEVTTNICANNRNSCQFRNSSSFSSFLYIPPIGTFLQGTSNSVWKQFCLKARNAARHPSPLRGAPQKVLLGARLCTRLTGYPGTKTL